MSPFPVTVAEFMVTEAVPVDVKVTDCAAELPTFTLPKVRLELLIPSVDAGAPSCNAKVWATFPALAVSVTVCAEVTEETVAVKLAVFDPAGTVTEAGTVTSLLLLAKLTANPAVAAAVFRVTVQLSVPGPVIEPLAQVSRSKPAYLCRSSSL